MVSVLVCDDAPAIRQSLRKCMSLVPEIESISTAASGEELLARYPVERPDLVFLDIQMPGLGGLQSLKRLLDTHHKANVLMLTMGDSPKDVANAVAAGAMGYVAKDASPQEFAAVLAATKQPTLNEGVPQQRENRSPPLTERERQVLQGMSDGRSNAQIGHDLFLSEDTVKTHARRLFRKLQVSDRGHAVAEGFRNGVLG
jgi:DNA-binding NarL/FixJ family response regulator